MFKTIRILYFVIFSAVTFALQASESYQPSKVVYDLSSDNAVEIMHILDRVSLLQKVYGNDPFDSSIVLVIHEKAIPFFTKQNRQDIERRAASLATGEIIQFRICRASASMQQLSDRDFHKFIQLVPMADAEIIRLQGAGYAYLR